MQDTGRSSLPFPEKILFLASFESLDEHGLQKTSDSSRFPRIAHISMQLLKDVGKCICSPSFTTLFVVVLSVYRPELRFGKICPCKANQHGNRLAWMRLRYIVCGNNSYRWRTHSHTWKQLSAYIRPWTGKNLCQKIAQAQSLRGTYNSFEPSKMEACSSSFLFSSTNASWFLGPLPYTPTPNILWSFTEATAVLNRLSICISCAGRRGHKNI